MKSPDDADLRIAAQIAEFDAADKFAAALRRHNMTAVVDDDYPQVRHEYEDALANLLDAMRANHRFKDAGNRYGLTAVRHDSISADVLEELERAKRKFPTWPTDPLHAVAVLGEEYGELNKAVLQAVYEPHKSGRVEVREEAIQTAAMALRFIDSLEQYRYHESHQHLQKQEVDYAR